MWSSWILVYTKTEAQKLRKNSQENNKIKIMFRRLSDALLEQMIHVIKREVVWRRQIEVKYLKESSEGEKYMAEIWITQKVNSRTSDLASKVDILN